MTDPDLPPPPGGLEILASLPRSFRDVCESHAIVTLGQALLLYRHLRDHEAVRARLAVAADDLKAVGSFFEAAALEVILDQAARVEALEAVTFVPGILPPEERPSTAVAPGVDPRLQVAKPEEDA